MSFNFIAAVTVRSDFRAQENKICHCFNFFSHLFTMNWWVGQDAMILVFWILNFKPAFSLFFTLIKKLFSSSSLSAIRVVSSAYLRLLIFFLAIWIPVCDTSGLYILSLNLSYSIPLTCFTFIKAFMTWNYLELTRR